MVNITGNNYAIQLSSGTTPGIKDWRIMDLEINGNSGTQTNGVQAEGGIDQVTLLRLNIHHVHFGVQLSPFILDYYGGQHRLWDQFAVVDSTIRTHHRRRRRLQPLRRRAALRADGQRVHRLDRLGAHPAHAEHRQGRDQP